MNIRKERLDMFQAVYTALRPRLEETLTEEQRLILYYYLSENKGLMEIAELMHFTDYKIVKDELVTIEARILSLG
ncbi:hypothetical protein [Bacteroides caecimuris]|jgi:hypothetical protein|uniref:hypothetical protein n=2 Tax=Bacteroidales TaxID=171549 RepID=UPI001A342235|nr:hypothetical protein [Bacteroides caecimuris]MBJ2184295.1 hypothetical protein [Muribaculaceae bacterium]